jgi:hypothetical protein
MRYCRRSAFPLLVAPAATQEGNTLRMSMPQHSPRYSLAQKRRRPQLAVVLDPLWKTRSKPWWRCPAWC